MEKERKHTNRETEEKPTGCSHWQRKRGSHIQSIPTGQRRRQSNHKQNAWMRIGKNSLYVKNFSNEEESIPRGKLPGEEHETGPQWNRTNKASWTGKELHNRGNIYIVNNKFFSNPIRTRNARWRPSLFAPWSHGHAHSSSGPDPPHRFLWPHSRPRSRATQVGQLYRQQNSWARIGRN